MFTHLIIPPNVFILFSELDNPVKKKVFQERIDSYLSRAEALKQKIQEECSKETYHEAISIENDSTGHSYDTVFGRFFDHKVETIVVEDPYVRSFHQVGTGDIRE